MKSETLLRTKLEGARRMYAEAQRAARMTGNSEAVLEAAKFYAGIRTLEWVLEKETNEAKR